MEDTNTSVRHLQLCSMVLHLIIYMELIGFKFSTYIIGTTLSNLGLARIKSFSDLLSLLATIYIYVGNSIFPS